ncbi:MAG: MerR family transcriptional regulator [Candidatus Bipolaricaulia bacterium]
MGGREISLLKIGEFAKKGGVSKRSLRHYEELDLLTPEKRSSGGFRLYEENDLFKLEIVKIFKELGFTLEEIKEILQSREEAKKSKGEQIDYSQDVLKKQLAEVGKQIRELKERRKLIEQGIEALEECRDCSREGCPEHCGNRRYFL